MTTATVRRYPGACPDASPFAPHDLIPHPKHPGAYVCPIEYDNEPVDGWRDQVEAQVAAERQADAERIAALIIQMEGAGIQIPTELDSLTRGALVRAALTGLTANPS